MTKIKILGTEYTIEYKTRKEEPRFEKIDGCCDYSIKKIVCVKRIKEDKDLLI